MDFYYLLLDDNAKRHTTALTQQTLEDLHWQIGEHPSNSPVLSVCGYHLFGPLKEILGGEKFEKFGFL